MSAVLNIEQIVDWRGQDVFDLDGERLGKLDEVYYDRASGEARLAAIKSGLLGRHGMLVPLQGASAGRDYVRVAFTAQQVKQTEDVDIDETLSQEALAQVTSAYDVDLTSGGELEAATLIERRRAEAQAAIARADALERDALAAADASKEARRRAEESAGAADDAERSAGALRDEAVTARQAAETARRDAGLAPPPAD